MTETWRCDHCNYPNDDGDGKFARCSICGGEDFTKVDTPPAPSTVGTVEEFREHSVTLNEVAWKIAVALGDVPEGATQVEGNVLEQVDRLITKANPSLSDDDVWALSSFLFSVYDHGTAPNAREEAEAILGHLTGRGWTLTPATIAEGNQAPTTDQGVSSQ